MLGLTFDKILVITLIAAMVLGPQRLPSAAASLGRVVRNLRKLAEDTAGRLREEVGPEFDDIDWTRLDPRQYDPRRIIRDALTIEPRQTQTDRVRADRDEDRPEATASPAETAGTTTKADAA
ncbi:twin-arginine translocase TatA/TatE family subunit [Leifsonia sp. NPDC014704]|uniref:twin-arginine translocase TatA/TatE family subunit n=1 Tax=Leifsonia sp. NPDC014704 TaxID=3364123 RepID=UPI0036F4AD58